MADDPYKYFRVEARELVEQLGKGALDLEKGASDPVLVARLLRFAHTLKGAARVVKQPEIADQAHAVEGALAPYRGSTVSVPRDSIDFILKLLDDIGRRVAALSPTSEMEVASAGHLQPGDLIRTVRADIDEMNNLLDGVVEAHAKLGLLKRSLADLERARRLVDLLSEQLAARSRGSRPSANGKANGKAVSVAEGLRGVFGTLNRTLANGVDQVDRELRQVRDAAERLRLVPAAALFTSLERSARDVARAQGKRVVFEGRGGDLRLDAPVLDVIHGALLQIVRNAVAHGIEPEADRKAAGKPLEGRVLLEVGRRGRRVVFRCQDDGRGIDVEAVRRVVQRRGHQSTDTHALGPEELARMLLQGGISTSGTVTEVSGRGIGLDVVREATEQLGGNVSVQTQPGRGVTVEIVVPLSLSSLEALLVETSGLTAAIPLEAVRNSVRVAPDGFTRTGAGDTILHDARVIPFLPLARMLFATPAQIHAERSWSTVIVEGTGGMAALGVDRLCGTSTVVLRPLPGLAPAATVVAGVFLDLEGNPQLVLDPDSLIAGAQRADSTEPRHAVPRRPVLVIDDSPTTRMLEQSILESAGYGVDIATSGEEALEKARRKRYALFLVDIEMPGIDGFTFIERVHADPGLRDVPSILVTSRASAEDMKRGEEVGAQGYVVKSDFNQDNLLERIRKLVG